MNPDFCLNGDRPPNYRFLPERADLRTIDFCLNGDRPPNRRFLTEWGQTSESDF
ncbi:MAG: hypothetical protein LBQ77_05150 [Treponema sp.]|nr:hypothetical protein [Treponema sp.]